MSICCISGHVTGDVSIALWEEEVEVVVVVRMEVRRLAVSLDHVLLLVPILPLLPILLLEVDRHLLRGDCLAVLKTMEAFCEFVHG